MKQFTKGQYAQLLLHINNYASLREFVQAMKEVSNADNVTIDDCIEFVKTNDNFVEADSEKLNKYLSSCEKQDQLDENYPAIVFNTAYRIDFMQDGDSIEKWQRYVSNSPNIRVFWAKYNTEVLEKIQQIL
jgi:hypothetical protein